MDKKSLMDLGLSKAEAELYLALLKLGSSPVQDLVQETGFYKSNIYLALERLCDKGIISKIVERKVRVYQIQDPRSLVDYIDKKKDDLEIQKKLAIALSQTISSSKKSKAGLETAAVYKGIAGVKMIYSDIVRNKSDYFVFGSPLASEKVVPDFYWKNLHAKQHELGITAKMIFHKSLRHWAKDIVHKEIKLKFLDSKIEPITETTIYGTRVAIVVWTDVPVVTIINNEHVAQSYKLVFDLLWEIAKP